MNFETFSEQETKNIGQQIAKNSKASQIYCLSGDLGVGKTQFTKGFALGLGINEHITSPTFTILQEYHQGRLPFYHFDVYRLSHFEELFDLGYEDYFFGSGICLIEWAEIINPIIPKDSIWINIKKDLSKGEDYRLIEVNL